MKSFILSSAGLKNLVHNSNYEEDFTFYFSKKEMKMKNIYAEFISPYVSQIHLSDPTINSINFPSKNSSSNQANLYFLQTITEEVFSLFNSISVGECIEINETQCIQLQMLSILLQNKELFSKLDKLFPKENEYDENKLIENLKFISFAQENLKGLTIFNQSKIIQYISSNLYSIDTKKIIELPKSVFYSIISNDELTIENEDFLLDLIENYFINQKQKQKHKEEEEEENEEDKFDLFDFYNEINFDFLSANKFKEFIENFNSNKMTTSLWNKLKKCFYVYKNSSSSEKENSNHHYKSKGRKIEYDGCKQHSLDGIISHLTKEA